MFNSLGHGIGESSGSWADFSDGTMGNAPGALGSLWHQDPNPSSGTRILILVVANKCKEIQSVESQNLPAVSGVL